MVADPTSGKNSNAVQSTVSVNGLKEEKSPSQNCCNGEGFCGNEPYQNGSIRDEPSTPVKSQPSINADEEEQQHSPETTTVWLRCDVYDTGIGIPGKLEVSSILWFDDPLFEYGSL